MSKNYDFDIMDVARVLGIRPVGRQRGGTQECVCPFCGSKTGSFAVSVYNKSGKTINVYRCLRTSCNAKGNMFQLYMHLKGISSYHQAEKEIRELIDNGYVADPIDEIIPSDIRPVECASDEALDRVYRKMYEYMRLSDRDKANLIRRGLSEGHLDEFRSIPIDKEERRRICRCIMREGLSLCGVPGFYKNRYGVWDMSTYEGNDGYFCPAYSPEGLLYGFQIRLAKPTPEKKYVSFSSNGRANGSSGGARATYLWGEDKATVILTEGILKATIIYRLLGSRISVVGIPGINQKACLDHVLENLKKVRVSKIYQAYDMDRCSSTVCHRDYKEDKCVLCTCGIADHKIRECTHKRRKTDGLGKSWLYLQDRAFSMGFGFKRLLWGLKPDKTWDGINKGFDDYLSAILSMKNEGKIECEDLVEYLFYNKE